MYEEASPLIGVTLDISELCGHFSIALRKNINAPQAPWLAITHFSINPTYYSTIAGHDDFLGIEPGFDGMRSDPRFAGLLRGMNFPP